MVNKPPSFASTRNFLATFPTLRPLGGHFSRIGRRGRPRQRLQCAVQHFRPFRVFNYFISERRFSRSFEHHKILIVKNKIYPASLRPFPKTNIDNRHSRLCISGDTKLDQRKTSEMLKQYFSILEKDTRERERRRAREREASGARSAEKSTTNPAVLSGLRNARPQCYSH